MIVRVLKIEHLPDGSNQKHFFNTYKSLEEAIICTPARFTRGDGTPYNLLSSLEFAEMVTRELFGTITWRKIPDPRPVRVHTATL